VDASLLTSLLGLRYRLQWAHARTGGGRVVLFAVGWLFATLAGGLVALGGLGAAFSAVRLGQAGLVAHVTLGGTFVCATLTAIMLGVGVEPAFSDVQLRRYPLSPAGRRVTRHVTALMGPLWLVVLALNVGLAIGFCRLGIGRAWLAVPAALLLVLANYLSARLLVEVVQRLLRRPVASWVLAACGVLIALAAPALFLHADVGQQVAEWLSPLLCLAPPGAAAIAMTVPGLVTATGAAAGLLAWVVGLLGALLALAGRPLSSRAAVDSPVRWDDACDRVAAIFGEQLGPLVAKNLRYYVRSAHLRWNFPIIIPGLLVVIWQATRHRADDPQAWFLAVLAAFSCLGLATGGLSLNVFGFDGAGFRRYFLFPVDPTRVVLAAGLVSLAPGLLLIPLALALWLLYGPGTTDLRMLVMLVAGGIGGVFFYQGMGLWSSLLGPRLLPLKVTFGKTLSLCGNVAMMAGIYWMLFMPQAAVRLGAPLMQNWWILLLYAVAGLAFLAVTVHAGGRLMGRRRERMLARIDLRTGAART